MDTADYLVVSGYVGRVTTLMGAITYLGPTQTELLNSCLLKRITNDGFVLWKEIPPIGALIFKRI